VGKYLDIALQVEREMAARGCAESAISAERGDRAETGTKEEGTALPRIPRLTRTLSALESRCPRLVPVARWQQAVLDGRRFLAKWGEQAEALGWTSRDLFGLHIPPAKPHPSYSRLSRYDEIGLVWLLRGRPVVALTEATAAIQNPAGNITIYRRHNKPALGPLGDSLDDFK
jgi:hypothetical protein